MKKSLFIFIFVISILLTGCERNPEIDDAYIINEVETYFNAMLEEVSQREDLTCDDYFVRNSPECTNVFIKYLALYQSDFTDDVVFTKVGDSVLVEITAKDDKSFQFVFDYELIDETIYFTDVSFQRISDDRETTKEEIANFFAEMLLDRETDPEVLCDEYVSVKYQQNCLNERDYQRLFDDRFEGISLYRVDSFTYLYYVALKEDHRIIYQYYITMESLGEAMRIDNFISINQSVINEPDELEIYVNQYMQDVSPRNVKNICFTSSQADTECLTIMAMMDIESILYDYDIDNERLYFNLILAGDKKINMRFIVSNYLNENYQLSLVFELEDYTVENDFYGPGRVSDLLSEIFTLDYGRVQQGALCDTYITASSSDLLYECKTNLDFFQSLDGVYEISNVYYLGGTSFSVEAFNENNTEKERYTVSLEYKDNTQRWMITDYDRVSNEMMFVTIPIRLLNDAFEAFSQINPYDYCEYQTKRESEISTGCIVSFFNEREKGFEYELFDTVNAPQDNTFYVKYYKYNSEITYVVESVIKVFAKESGYYYEESVEIEYEIIPDNLNLYDRVERLYQEYINDYLDPSITGNDLFDMYIYDRFDDAEFATERAILTSQISDITLHDISPEVNGLYESVFEVDFTIYYNDDTEERRRVTVKVFEDDGVYLSPIFNDFEFEVNIDEMKDFFKDFVDAAYTDSIGNFTCTDILGGDMLKDCVTPAEAIGDPIVDFEVYKHTTNVFRITMQRSTQSSGDYVQNYLVEVALIDGQIKVISISPYQDSA